MREADSLVAGFLARIRATDATFYRPHRFGVAERGRRDRGS